MGCSLCGVETQQCAITAHIYSICYRCINKGIQQFEVISCWRTGVTCLNTYQWSLQATQTATQTVTQTATSSELSPYTEIEETRMYSIATQTDKMDRKTQISPSSMYYGDSKKKRGRKHRKPTFY
tara:strand:- start:54 stop:428 length:375 start_codon:yes stop_codon:yes gene_type:complete